MTFCRNDRKTSLFTAAMLLAATFATGCSEGPVINPAGPSPNPNPTPNPTPVTNPRPNPTPPSQPVIRVTVDGASCRGITNVQILIDGVNLGTVTPGDGGLSRSVTVGDHSISAQAVGQTWPTRTINVPAGGYDAMFTCSGNTGNNGGGGVTPPKIGYGYLNAILDSSTCYPSTTSANVYLDGRFVTSISTRTASPLQRLLAGNYVIRAEASNRTWSTTSITIQSDRQLNFTFYCR